AYFISTDSGFPTLRLGNRRDPLAFPEDTASLLSLRHRCGRSDNRFRNRDVSSMASARSAVATAPARVKFPPRQHARLNRRAARNWTSARVLNKSLLVPAETNLPAFRSVEQSLPLPPLAPWRSDLPVRCLPTRECKDDAR